MNPVRPQILLWILILTLGAALPLRAEGPRDARYAHAVATYNQADPAGKLRFIEDLLARSNDACSVILSGTPLAYQRSRNQAILSQAAQGRELSERGLRQLLAEVDQQQQRAIAKLRRDYAFSTAQAFHDNRTDFDRWTAAWERIERQYEQDGRPLGWQSRMIDWLALASARQAQLHIARIDSAPARPGSGRSALRTIPPRRGPSIQHSELEARIAGYNLAVAKLISELHAERTWTAEDLGRTAVDLAELATARHDLQLYWDLLPAATQATMPPLRTLDDVISLLASRTADRRREMERAAEESPRAAWELRRLDEVSRRLATLAVR